MECSGAGAGAEGCGVGVGDGAGVGGPDELHGGGVFGGLDALGCARVADEEELLVGVAGFGGAGFVVDEGGGEFLEGGAGEVG